MLQAASTPLPSKPIQQLPRSANSTGLQLSTSITTLGPSTQGKPKGLLGASSNNLHLLTKIH
jgi:hypothetical protein